MRTTKKIIFKVHNVEVDSVIGDEINLQELDSLKISIAFAHNVGTQDIDVDTIDIVVPDISTTCAVSNTAKGELLFKTNSVYSCWRVVKGISPAMDINHEDLFHEFLDLIQKKDIDNAIIFN